MKTIPLFVSAIALAGCVTTTPATRGSIYAVTDKTVTVRGAFSQGQIAKPTEAMVAQAREICPGARYLSANPSPTDYDTFHYLFLC